MPASNYHIGDYTVKTSGNIDLSSKGTNTSIQATGSESSMMLTAQKAVGIFSGATSAVFHNNEPEGGMVTVGVGETGSVKLTAGPPLGGVTIKLQGPETLELAVGAPGVGSSITMGPESIVFRVAEVSFTLTPEGITEIVGEVTREVTPEGHNFTAGETELNIGLQGFSGAFPTRMAEIEAGEVNSAALSEITTEGIRNGASLMEIDE